MVVNWYPRYDSYYVPNPEPTEWPVRQGDVISPPEQLGPESNDPWLACQIVHPSCEIGAKRDPKQLQVIRVLSLAEFTDANDQTSVVQGYKEKDDVAQIAFAYSFFLPPVPGFADPLYSDFRQIQVVPRSSLSPESRLGALTHDARVFFIRRKLYWEQRWFIEPEEVFRIEGERIRNDPNFVGPRPEWAA